MSLGVRLMSLGVGLEEELRDEFGGDFDEFDEFGGYFLVCLREKGLSLMSLAMRLMSLGVRSGQKRGDEFGDGFESLMSLGVISRCVCEERG